MVEAVVLAAVISFLVHASDAYYPTAAGFQADPLQGRTFGLQNFFPTVENVQSQTSNSDLDRYHFQMSKRIHALHYQISSLAVNENLQHELALALQDKVTTQGNQIASLINDVTLLQAATPKCLTTSAATVAAKFIAQYQKCYSLEAGPKTYVQAQEQCMQQGGTLAEPLYSDGAFYQNLVTTFSASAISAITSGLYVGVSQIYTGNNVYQYVYNTNLVVIPSSNTIWQTTPPLTSPNPNTKKVAYIAPALGPAYAWKLTPEIDGFAVSKGFVCQYPVW